MPSKKDKKLQKQKKREREKRKALEAERLQRRRENNLLAREEADRPEVVTPSGTGGLGTERVLGRLQRLMKDREFDSQEDMQGYLDELLASGVLDEDESLQTPEDQARELAMQAFEAEDHKRCLTLSQEALELDPLCPEALLALADLQPNADKHHKALELARRAAASRLGEEFFEREVGHFWGILETRTYMRATLGVAMALWNRGDAESAIELANELLVLNPSDNQGVRYELLGWYLAEGQLEDAEQLREAYEDDDYSGFAWAAVLRCFLLGDEPGAARELRAARAANAAVEGFLLDLDNIPPRPEFWSPGAESEALLVAHQLGDAWGENPEALDWLKDH